MATTDKNAVLLAAFKTVNESQLRNFNLNVDI